MEPNAPKCMETDCPNKVRVQLAGFRDGRGYCNAHVRLAFAYNRGMC